jgi:hypothetical protein
MPHSAELRLRAMPPSVKFKSKILLPTPRYAAQRGVVSALCRIAESCNSDQCLIAQSCDSVLYRIELSRFLSLNRIKLLSEFESICKIHVPRGTVQKNRGQRFCEIVPLRCGVRNFEFNWKVVDMKSSTCCCASFRIYQHFTGNKGY